MVKRRFTFLADLAAALPGAQTPATPSLRNPRHERQDEDQERRLQELERLKQKEEARNNAAAAMAKRTHDARSKLTAQFARIGSTATCLE